MPKKNTSTTHLSMFCFTNRLIDSQIFRYQPLFRNKICFDSLTNVFSFVFQPLAASDYLQISQYFHTVIIKDIPRLTLDSKSQARRFITLIDTLYDNKVRVRKNTVHFVMNFYFKRNLFFISTFLFIKFLSFFFFCKF